MCTLPIVYLAGPIVGLTQADAQTWREEFNEMVSSYGIVCLSPVRGKNLCRINEVYSETSVPALGTSTDLFDPHVLTQRDLFDLARSQAIVLHMGDPARRPLGSMIEVGFAFARRIPVIVWGPPSDVTRHPMVQHIRYRHTFSLPETVHALVDLLGMGDLH